MMKMGIVMQPTPHETEFTGINAHEDAFSLFGI
jgi:hypothetical protein